MKYRRKPVIIEAEQWYPGKDIAGVIPISAGVSSTETADGSAWPAYATIKTAEGYVTVSPGDWIVTDAAGQPSLCKSDVFDATYEALEE